MYTEAEITAGSGTGLVVCSVAFSAPEARGTAGLASDRATQLRGALPSLCVCVCCLEGGGGPPEAWVSHVVAMLGLVAGSRSS